MRLCPGCGTSLEGAHGNRRWCETCRPDSRREMQRRGMRRLRLLERETRDQRTETETKIAEMKAEIKALMERPLWD